MSYFSGKQMDLKYFYTLFLCSFVLRVGFTLMLIGACMYEHIKKINGSVISSIGQGLLLLVGISSKDTKDDLEYMTRKVLNIRLFDDENGKKWSKSVRDKECEILCVSQFTLCSVLKGNRVDFHNAMKPEESKTFYENFVETLKSNYKPEMIKNGAFGEYMEIELCNDGPVTIYLESKASKDKESGECS